MNIVVNQNSTSWENKLNEQRHLQSESIITTTAYKSPVVLQYPWRRKSQSFIVRKQWAYAIQAFFHFKCCQIITLKKKKPMDLTPKDITLKNITNIVGNSYKTCTNFLPHLCLKCIWASPFQISPVPKWCQHLLCNGSIKLHWHPASTTGKVHDYEMFQ